MTGKDLIKLLRDNGWELHHIRGSHHIMCKNGKRLSVPVHSSKDMHPGLLHKLMKKAGLK
jgi:predicted RNA binding protein YcfA (HicA-like mRNA interferase family)